MLIQAAEAAFQQGMQAMTDGRHREALAFFEASVEVEKRLGVRQQQARYLSYYGLCLGLTRTRLRQAMSYCRRAVEIETYNPEFRWNLGRVLLAARLRKSAWKAFAQGLRLSPNHEGIVRSMRLMGSRRRPAIPFLARGNALNVFLGRRMG